MASWPSLVIFDCDGVLVDSETISIAVLRQAITDAGHHMDEATAYRLLLGRSMATIRDTLSARYGLQLGDAELDVIRARLFERLHRELNPIPGIGDVLAGFPYRRCVASSSRPERIRLSLGLTGLLDRLEPHIFSATMVKKGKPAPDLFLHAAREMETAPTECVVIEDSPAGIEAAKAAGMRVFAFAGGAHAQAAGLEHAFQALAPDRVFSDMRQLPALLADVSGSVR